MIKPYTVYVINGVIYQILWLTCPGKHNKRYIFQMVNNDYIIDYRAFEARNDIEYCLVK